MQSADFLSAVFFYLKEGENLNQNWIVENLNNAFSTLEKGKMPRSLDRKSVV